MIKFRRIYDDTLPANREAIRQVKEILRNTRVAARPGHIETIDEKLRNPFNQRFKTVLLVREDTQTVSSVEMPFPSFWGFQVLPSIPRGWAYPPKAI